MNDQLPIMQTNEGSAAIELRLESVDATMALGDAVAGMAQLGEVIALDGELGAGKTQFVRGMAARLLGDGGVVASPTFVIVHEYGPIVHDPQVGGTLVHVDAYRIGGEQELASIGWSAPGGGELATDAIVVVEWASRIEPALGPDAMRIKLHHAADEERLATLTPPECWRNRFRTMRNEIESIDGACLIEN